MKGIDLAVIALIVALLTATAIYHVRRRRRGPLCAGVLTAEEAAGHCQAGSLTGAVASQRVTEAREGHLRANGNRLLSVRV